MTVMNAKHYPQPEDFSPQPLAANHFPLGSPAADAYNICLDLERRVATVELPSDFPPRFNALICPRVLGRTLSELACAEDRLMDFAQRIIEISYSDQKLLAFAVRFVQRLSHVFISHNEERTPAPSDDSTRPNFEDIIQFCSWARGQSSLSHGTAKQAALIRDGGHCAILPYMYERSWLLSRPDECRKILATQPNQGTSTRCAHILPEALMRILLPDTGRAPQERHTIGSLLGFFEDELDAPTDHSIHSLTNAITLEHDMRVQMNNMSLWLEATSGEGVPDNTYIICFSDPLTQVRIDKDQRIVSFTTPDEIALPVPSPQNLAVHAACCRIARMSGAAEYVENLIRNTESQNTLFLAPDGSSAELLANKLFSAGVR
ncbi:hypothetical protein QCA50_003277 [Cerrena zonata]|uniref:HNH nuclease domain-containing protein n=1 Tax=Cerrena zonata TaxID=2478898 RepID=A0AAW0GKE9_9APHY